MEMLFSQCCFHKMKQFSKMDAKSNSNFAFISENLPFLKLLFMPDI